MRTVLLAVRFIQTLLLLGGLASLAYGGYVLVRGIQFRLRSVEVQGDVVGHGTETAIQDRFGSSRRLTTSEPSVEVTRSFPRLRYRSPVDQRLHRFQSEHGFADAAADQQYRVGATVPVRASTTDPDDARLWVATRDVVVPVLFALAGLFAVALLTSIWHLPDGALGRDVPRGTSLFSSLRPASLLWPLAVGGLVWAAAAWAMPWVTPSRVALLWATPGVRWLHRSPGTLVHPANC